VLSPAGITRAQRSAVQQETNLADDDGQTTHPRIDATRRIPGLMRPESAQLT